VDELSHLGWVAHRSYELAGWLLGIRTNSEACGAWLDKALGRYRVLDEEAEPNYSILIGETGKVGKRFHLLYKDAAVRMRTFDLATLGRALFAEVEALAFAKRTDALYVEWPLVSLGGRTGLIPLEFLVAFERISRQVKRTGISLPLSTCTAIDLESGEAVPTPQTLDIREDAIALLAEVGPLQKDGVPPTIERPTRIDVVCSLAYERDEPVVPMSRGAAVYALAAFARNLDVVGGKGLAALRRLVERAECCQLNADFAEPTLERLTSVLAGGETQVTLAATT
jgi:hypothetical protein